MKYRNDAEIKDGITFTKNNLIKLIDETLEKESMEYDPLWERKMD